MNRIKTLSPRHLARKVPRAVRRRLRHRGIRLLDRVSATHSNWPAEGELRRILPDLSDFVPSAQYAALAGVTTNYVNGRFEILGSGWIEWSYGSPPSGREGHRYDPGVAVRTDPQGNWLADQVTTKNFPASRKLWQMVEGPYEPIDWQLDARSGARWSAHVHALDTPFGKRRGADVKVPWELGRMHHLPRLALAHGLARQGRSGFMMASEYSRAYRNQVCDFLALNPPRFGCNWATAMLSGIRVANILLAHDLFKASGAEFDSEFESVIHRAVTEHVDHILHHLDWLDLDSRNNHYLANIAGLSFAAAYLPRSEESATLLAFCRRELDREIEWQFNRDGSHFEGSTAYHAFCAEMVAWSAAILGAAQAPEDLTLPRTIPSEPRKRALAVTAPGSPESWIGSIRAMHSFLAQVRRPDGLLVQVGDNDSGRFFKLDVSAECTRLGTIRRRYLNLRELPEDPSPYWSESYLDYASTAGALAGIVSNGESSQPPRAASDGERTVSEAATAALRSLWTTNARRVPSKPPPVQDTSHAGTKEEAERLAAQPGVRICTQRFPKESALSGGSGVSLRQGLEYMHYPDFGLCVFRSDRLWLSVRVGGAIRADGGHSHADALSFELHLDGVAYRVDPGTYVYTSLPWRRQQFRSEAAHGIPRLRGRTSSEEVAEAFVPVREFASDLITLDHNGLVGCRHTSEGTVYRSIRIQDQSVEIADYSTDGQPIHLEPLPWWSPGYGQLAAFDPGQVCRRSEVHGCASPARQPDRAPGQRVTDRPTLPTQDQHRA